MEVIVETARKQYPRKISNNVTYGTAGFRMNADILDFLAYRMGILASLRSKSTKAVIGVMITASHNPEADNGMKIVDPLGEMMTTQWEGYATRVANASDDDLVQMINEVVLESELDMDEKATVFLGKDTRPSSNRLAAAFKAGVEVINATVQDYGLLTTPQLHYMVWSHNSESEHSANEDGYFLKMSSAFYSFLKTASTKYLSPKLTVDGANGVGAGKARQLMKFLQPCSEAIELNVVNDGSSGVLNLKCGADYVKSNQIAPEGLVMQPMAQHCSYDGDADRIIFYFVSEDGKFHLMDGDKIAVLVAGHLKELLNAGGLSHLNLGLVQTAYANGSSTKYITDGLKVPVACAKTGVKHLHHEALNFDIGVYFEANGHGTVLFTEKAEQAVEEAAESADELSDRGKAILQLCSLMHIINQAVGDALSDMLLVEAILIAKGWTVADWDKQYTDLPNMLLKVLVKDRTVIQTTNAERTATSPPGLQDAVDAIVAKYEQGRAFVRPSGTEDVVRVYAEAASKDACHALAYEVAELTFDMCSGVGDRPAAPK